VVIVVARVSYLMGNRVAENHKAAKGAKTDAKKFEEVVATDGHR
jgi:hypothetical protein